MNHKIILGYTLFIFALLGSSLTFDGAEGNINEVAATKASPPNILLIIADDLGWGDLGYLGSSIPTPSIDQLAKEGLQLRRFYTAPICSPTRAGLLTGRYPNRYGLRNNVIRPWLDFGLDTTETTLPEVLAGAGYTHRALIGKWHLGHSRKAFHPLARGYTYFYGCLNGAIDYFRLSREGERDWHENYSPSSDQGYATDLITDKALDKLSKYAAEQSPFFLQVAYNAPHSPLQAQPKYLKRVGFDPSQPRFMPGPAKGNTKRQTYAAMVANLDDGIGALLGRLEELGITENTLVIFMSDNGATPVYGGSSGELRGAKLTEWEGGVRCPAIIRWPNRIKGGQEIDQLTAYVDLFPTLRTIAAAPINTFAKPIDGLDLAPLLLGRQKKLERSIYIGNGVVMTERWKYFNHRYTTKRLNLRRDQLFQIDKDATERKNLIDQRSLTKTSLQQELARYQKIPSSLSPPSDKKPAGFVPPAQWKIDQ